MPRARCARRKGNGRTRFQAAEPATAETSELAGLSLGPAGWGRGHHLRARPGGDAAHVVGRSRKAGAAAVVAHGQAHPLLLRRGRFGDLHVEQGHAEQDGERGQGADRPTLGEETCAHGRDVEHVAGDPAPEPGCRILGGEDADAGADLAQAIDAGHRRQVRRAGGTTDGSRHRQLGQAEGDAEPAERACR